jgi:hypothetical protein
LERAFESFIGLLLGPLALALADVGPGGLDVGHGAPVDGIDVAASKVVKHVSTQLLAVHHLSFNAVDDFASEAHELLHEFRSQLLDRNLLEGLEVLFFREGADHSTAISLLKEGLKHTTNAVLLLDTV